MLNSLDVVAEITALHAEYEAALVSNDVAKLTAFFWESEHALRFGVNESLYGAREIEEFRKNRPVVDLARQVSNLRIVTFGSDTAIVTLEFDRSAQGVNRHGRQSQVWRKFDVGWKIVSAHVSLVPMSYPEVAGPLSRLPVPYRYVAGVKVNLERAAAIAAPLLETKFDDEIEAAPTFTP
jgi:ketosteroid isomerase-like protein